MSEYIKRAYKKIICNFLKNTVLKDIPASRGRNEKKIISMIYVAHRGSY